MLIITGIPNDNTNELIIYGILCRNVTTFYRQELVSLFQVQEKLKDSKNSKCSFNADDSHKILWLYVVVFSEYNILKFRENVHLLKYNPVKVL